MRLNGAVEEDLGVSAGNVASESRSEAFEPEVESRHLRRPLALDLEFAGLLADDL